MENSDVSIKVSNQNLVQGMKLDMLKILQQRYLFVPETPEDKTKLLSLKMYDV